MFSTWTSQRSIQLLLLLFTFLSLTSLVAASTPTSFCKCTCFSNSTIIPLNPAKSESSSGIDHVRFYERDSLSSELEHTDEYSKRAEKYRSLNCNDCNRKFCLDYELPTCKGAKEEDVYTTCFQRDSRKDEAVVFIFIFATGGLLAWAACKPWIERYVEAARERRSYIPVAEPDR
ncbi:hypothetical protein DTO013E5_5929 [Penicillium roqueforti]|uniref:Uncharacterized protein n=1 Tax=Penicillium roqueforti (strain FM164) TaxID=1365484 RepID=W6PY84_PENRF|nr:uncharacterized protein LCP9604111_7333 [Penicillium roqueforti]XP_057046842.1 uncharacterized protein N7518_000564 [Penicillium psychrosexuale]CDM29228.1 hypothetical protein PROQFM164_S01g003040 [Penicillium roqueforti FM164]KAF9244380.1 hypothetical protein LCP9604111_7333 [Penicillium roqueforti]KAI1835961.1 hypothetical protein CBS147337_3110 [Penicillium roqueforti]KAI2678349.1 hypothetical protein LCP963914a_7780 [Penicillium roqueforti]KAI2682983.1 hypothetical protein CBS147355_21